MAFTQICASQDTICSEKLKPHWMSIWEEMNQNQTIFFVISYSTNAMIENSTDLMKLKDYIVSPIVVRPSQEFRNTDMYEVAGIPRSEDHRDLMFLRVFTGKLLSYGRYYCKFEQKFMEQMTYGFFDKTSHTTLNTTVEGVALFQSCQMTINAKKQISVLKAWILFVSVFDELQRLRIAANITSYIEAAEMQDYVFDEFRDKRVKSCENLKNHFVKCKADINKAYIDILFWSIIVLFVISVAAVKSFYCIREIRPNRVHNIRDQRF